MSHLDFSFRVSALGYVKVKVKVRNPKEKRNEFEVELLPDTGAIYSIIPSKVLENLKIEPTGARKMRLADGRVIERHLGIAELEVKGEVAHSNVIFGEDQDAAVLGVTALEELGLQVDPVTGELKPMELLLL
jgi:clan AA aspartic protease